MLYEKFETLSRIEACKVVLSSSYDFFNAQVHAEAEKIFHSVGKVLKQRRGEDDYESLHSYLKDPAAEDPAMADVTLAHQLEQQDREAKKKLDKVFDEFTERQFAKGKDREEEEGEDQDDSEVDAEEEEENEDDYEEEAKEEEVDDEEAEENSDENDEYSGGETEYQAAWADTAGVGREGSVLEGSGEEMTGRPEQPASGGDKLAGGLLPEGRTGGALSAGEVTDSERSLLVNDDDEVEEVVIEDCGDKDDIVSIDSD